MTYEEARNRIYLHGKTMTEDEAFIILDALEKQIPKKPIYEDVGNVYGAYRRTCTECGDEVMISPCARELEKYCRFCGKRLIDWSDEE